MTVGMSLTFPPPLSRIKPPRAKAVTPIPERLPRSVRRASSATVVSSPKRRAAAAGAPPDADRRGGPRFEHKPGRIDRDAEAAKAAPQRPVGVDESQVKSGWGSPDAASHGTHSRVRKDT